MTAKLVKKCKPSFPNPVFCVDMREALNYDTLTGLSSETLYYLADPRGPQPKFEMVAVRRSSREKPRWLYFCPWCREPLVPVKKKGKTT